MDFIEHLRIPVEEYTTPGAVTASPNADFSEMMKKMKNGEFRHLPIMDGGKVVGLVSHRDLKLLEGLGTLATQVSASDIMHRDVYVVDSKASLEDVVFEMSSRKIGSAVISDGGDNSVGIFTSTDALNALIEIIRGEVPESED